MRKTARPLSLGRGSAFRFNRKRREADACLPFASCFFFDLISCYCSGTSIEIALAKIICERYAPCISLIRYLHA